MRVETGSRVESLPDREEGEVLGWTDAYHRVAYVSLDGSGAFVERTREELKPLGEVA